MKTFDPVTVCDLECSAQREQYYWNLYAALTNNRPPMDLESYRSMSELATKVWNMYLAAQEEKAEIKEKLLDSMK
jgi:hypothetical protein